MRAGLHSMQYDVYHLFVCIMVVKTEDNMPTFGIHPYTVSLQCVRCSFPQ